LLAEVVRGSGRRGLTIEIGKCLGGP